MSSGDRLLYEYVLKVEAGRYTCRVWCEMSQDLRRKMFIATYRAISERPDGDDLDIGSVVTKLVMEPGVNSVEIHDEYASVAVAVHKNWP